MIRLEYVAKSREQIQIQLNARGGPRQKLKKVSSSHIHSMSMSAERCRIFWVPDSVGRVIPNGG